ncbi:MAG TPA: alpha/beta hydrolase [Xanthobacteraceae bacterium]|nr:alpha/beta hydrolase [Xanthobacteraceae bacterium]
MISQRLRARLAAAFSDPEFLRLGAGLAATLRVRCGEDHFDIAFGDGVPQFVSGIAAADIEIAAAAADWDHVLASPPPPTFHSFTALAMANPAFTVSGAPQTVAQARAVLERLFERLTASAAAPAPAAARDLAQIHGAYRTITSDGANYDVYFEHAGNGPPLLLLHTAGADGRQYHAQLADVGLGQSWRMIAPDLPFHGRSMPPKEWDGGPYRLTAQQYLVWCAAIIEQVIGEPAYVAGGSMGAAIALVLAAARPDLVRGVVAIEPPYQSKGRRNPFQHHVGVHGGLHNASFVRGLMSPTSPEADRRRAAWIYSQGAPSIYSGDLAFYSEEFDGAETAPLIDASKTPVALLSGTYDYSATPADGGKLHALIPGSYFEIMEGLGHFPMCEHPDLFRPYFLRALAHIGAG